MEQETSPVQALTRKERRALKRAAKQEQKTQGQSKRGIKKIGLIMLGILAIAGAIGAFFLFAPEGQEPRPDLSQAIPDEGRSHVDEGTNVQYQSNPPTSGNHWPVPLSDGVYDKEKPDEAVTHSMEHGRVWVSYKPSIPDQTKKALEELAKKHNGTVLTPRSANDTDIALAAWNRLDTFNLNPDATFDESRITDFINRWRNKSPEFVPGSEGGKTYE